MQILDFQVGHGDGPPLKLIQWRRACFYVGASLLAKAVCHSPLMPTDTAPSRAGSLPQGIGYGWSTSFDGTE
ncbi:hypothetical protein FE275_06775 [Pseudomonas koreensis]|nr:hypothetical protein FE275_06775 [Pseudomonas koreensis]